MYSIVERQTFNFLPNMGIEPFYLQVLPRCSRWLIHTAMPVFMALTKEDTVEERKITARKATIYVFCTNYLLICGKLYFTVFWN